MDYFQDKIFLTQVFFSVITVSFCIGMIAQHPTPSTTAVFLPILTSVTSVWLPQPKQQKNEEQVIDNPV